MTKSTHVISTAVFLSSFGLLLVGIDRNAFNILDEGVIVYGAERVLGGEVPYRDFWSVYAPGQFWVVAALFKIFGPSLMVERLWDIVVRASIAALSYLIVDRLASRPLALAAWLISLGWLWVVGFYGYPLLPATLFTMLAAFLFMEVALKDGKQWLLFPAGAAVGVAAAFRHDVGFYAFFAIAVSLVAWRFIATSFRLGVGLLLLVSGICVTGIPVALYLILQVPFQDLWSQLIVFPATVYPLMRSIPYPSAIGFLQAVLELFRGNSSADVGLHLSYMLPFYFHFVIFGAAVLALVRAAGTWKESAASRGLWIAIFLLTGLIMELFLTSLVRPHQVHLIHVLVLSVVLGAALLKIRKSSLGKTAAALVALSLIGMGVYPLLAAIAVKPSMVSDAAGNGPPRAGRFRIPDDQAMAIKFVRERVPESEKIFVGNGRHDIAHISDVMFYFLSGRNSATNYHELHPGLTTTLAVQKRIVEQLVAARVNQVVLFTGADNIREPNKSAESTGVRLLDDFLAETYREEARIGSYSVRTRK